jgi:hypothetical protein
MCQACPGGWLIKGSYERLVRQKIAVLTFPSDRFEGIGHLENVEELVPFKSLERQDVASGEAPHSVSPLSALGGYGLRLL